MDPHSSSLTVADAKALVEKAFRRENSNLSIRDATQAVASMTQFRKALEKSPALIMVATVLFVLDQQTTVDPAGLTAALAGLNVHNE